MKYDTAIHLARVARVALGLMFIYQGLVPKILVVSATEIGLVEASGLGLPGDWVVAVAGVGEIMLGLMILLRLFALWPVYLAAAALVGLTLYVAAVMPGLLVEAFNPVSLNALAGVLCYVVICVERRVSAASADTKTPA